jgi:hypothetical protein
MKYLLLALPVILLTACQQNNAYTPGFGDLMSSIQVHHSKLWFAGKNQNWALAAYEESLIHSIVPTTNPVTNQDFNAPLR